MGLKLLIIIVFLALLVSLGSGLTFLFKDQENPDSRRLWNSLTVRLALAAVLMALVIYGTYTGQLRSQAPWDHQPSAAPAAPQSASPSTDGPTSPPAN